MFELQESVQQWGHVRTPRHYQTHATYSRTWKFGVPRVSSHAPIFTGVLAAMHRQCVFLYVPVDVYSNKRCERYIREVLQKLSAFHIEYGKTSIIRLLFKLVKEMNDIFFPSNRKKNCPY